MPFRSEKKLWWCSLVCVLVAVQGFVIQQQQSQQLQTTTTALFGRKKNGLSIVASDGVESTTSKKTSYLKQRSKRKLGPKSTTTTKKKKAEPAAAISPALAEWMASQEDGSETVAVEPVDDANNDDDDVADATAVAFQTFEKEEIKAAPANNRRVKQSERKEIDAKRAALVRDGVDALEAALEKAGNLDGILSAVKSLLRLPSDNLRLLLSGKRRFDYRLAWVGGDDAICHVGTGLHKVPLARLQEVFMSGLGRNRMEVTEVISIFGPFPNVRNILQGTTKIGSSSDDIMALNIVMDSMVDGTGKEILAGTDDNIRRVDLQIYFADERAIVAVVPPEDGGFRENPLEDNGVNVLVFVKEDELEDKLDALRVS
jgi:hypothetical protein